MLVSWTLPATSMNTRDGAVDHDVGDVVAGEQRLERAIAQNVVADVGEELFLLRNRHHDALDRDDLVDDVADFFARGIDVELSELRQIDRVDQRGEDHRLDVVVVVRAAVDSDRRRHRGRHGSARSCCGGGLRSCGRGRGRLGRSSRLGRGRGLGCSLLLLSRAGGLRLRRSALRPLRPRARDFLCASLAEHALPCLAVGHERQEGELGLLRHVRDGPPGDQARELADAFGGGRSWLQPRQASGRCWRQSRTAADRTAARVQAAGRRPRRIP